MGQFEYSEDRGEAKVSFPAHKFPYTASVYYECNVRLCAMGDPACKLVCFNSINVFFVIWFGQILNRQPSLGLGNCSFDSIKFKFRTHSPPSVLIINSNYSFYSNRLQIVRISAVQNATQLTIAMRDTQPPLKCILVSTSMKMPRSSKVQTIPYLRRRYVNSDGDSDID